MNEMPRKKMGRPTKAEGPKVPYEELDRLLVFGEVVESEVGGKTVYYPSYRELAERFNCSHSLICEYAKTRNTGRRRKEAQARLQAKVEQRILETRARAIAYAKEDELRIIDQYLAAFEVALQEGRVRADNPADFNAMVRLKELLDGNADSRSETTISLSLENLQARHKKSFQLDASSAERGEVESLPPGDSNSSVRPQIPPTEDASQEVAVQFTQGTIAHTGLTDDDGELAAPELARAAGDPAPTEPSLPPSDDDEELPAGEETTTMLETGDVSCAGPLHGTARACVSRGDEQ